MKLKAHLHRITNEKEFIASFIATDSKPTKGFTDFGKARVHLATDLPMGKFADQSSFIPPISFKADADPKGKVSIDIPDNPGNFRGYLIAYEQIGTAPQPLPNMPSIPIFAPVYRSDVFKLSSVTEGIANIFVKTRQTKNEEGLPQSEVDKMAAKLKKDNKFDKVSAVVKSNAVSCRVEKQGAEGTFNIRLRASTSSDLNQFIEMKAEDIDIDLPGPDFIVGICVSEDDIKKQLRQALEKLEKVVDGIVGGIIAEQIPPAAKEFLTFTVHQIHFPVTSHKTITVPHIGEQKIPLRSIVPDVTLGVPKKLF